MPRNGNYAAFYVTAPFNPSSLGAYATRDFCYYNMLRAWKGGDASFPFIDAHNTTYNVRDDSDWETTLKPRLRARLRNSKNILFFLSSNTKNSTALREEIDYGINDQGLPVILIYPDYESRESLLAGGALKPAVRALWDRLPIFRDSMHLVPTLHVAMVKGDIRRALLHDDLKVTSKTIPNAYFFNP
ncbi:MAG TPA: hypothetical protein VKE92_07260 [Anaerolineales bacterium]|nr:hypothetical protein [Anaerolineales bacterium]